MAGKKIVCLGAGSSYFAGALPDIFVMQGLSGSDVILYDIDRERAEIMAAHGRRLADLAGTAMTVRACHSLSEAVDGADFAVSAIGGSGPSKGTVYGSSVHLADIQIPARYGVRQIVGDTGGPAGMMMGLRSVPVYLEICREMEKRCPDVVLINHSNPMAILCRAMLKHTGLRNIVGICHGVQHGLAHAARILEVAPHELDAVWVGTNHYYWFIRLRYRGQDVYPELMRRVAERVPQRGSEMAAKLSLIYGFQVVYPDDAHVIEFYPFLSQGSSPEDVPYGMAEAHRSALRPDEHVQEAQAQSRAEQLDSFQQELGQIELPEGPSDPTTGEGLGVLIESIALGRRHVHIVNIPNLGCVPNLPDHAVLELEGVTDSVGVRGVNAGEAPLALAGLLQKRIAWQEMVVDAAVKGERNLVVQATLLDEMAIRPERAEAMVDELLAASKDYLPQFQ